MQEVFYITFFFVAFCQQRHKSRFRLRFSPHFCEMLDQKTPLKRGECPIFSPEKILLCKTDDSLPSQDSPLSSAPHLWCGARNKIIVSTEEKISRLNCYEHRPSRRLCGWSSKGRLLCVVTNARCSFVYKRALKQSSKARQAEADLPPFCGFLVTLQLLAKSQEKTPQIFSKSIVNTFDICYNIMNIDF